MISSSFELFESIGVIKAFSLGERLSFWGLEYILDLYIISVLSILPTRLSFLPSAEPACRDYNTRDCL